VFTLKGQFNENFTFDFFTGGLLTSSYSVFKDFINLASTSRIYLRFLTDPPLLFMAQSILPVLFHTASCDSPHHYS
jgi:hypothetical protein